MAFKQKNKFSELINLFLNTEELGQVNEYKFLGLNIDNRPTWSAHKIQLFQK